MRALPGERPVLDPDDELTRVRRDLDAVKPLDLRTQRVGRPPALLLDLVVDELADVLEDLVPLGGVDLLAGIEEAVVDVAVPRIGLEVGRFGLLAAEVDLRLERPDALRATLGDRDVILVDLVVRSEEHTSELQSLRHLVCRLLLE